jgi:C-terminal processing protease CtpA/Prc
VAVLVGPACASACEFFSYDLTLNDRAVIVGQYPSEGAGGSVEAFFMPEDIYCQLTTGRAMDADENIHLEGRGVVPAVKVPVTAETLSQQAAESMSAAGRDWRLWVVDRSARKESGKRRWGCAALERSALASRRNGT